MRSLIIFLVINFGILSSSISQSMKHGNTLAVLSIDAQMFKINSEEFSEIARLEIAAFGMHKVMDYYHMIDILEKKELDNSLCYSTYCMTKIGKSLKTQRVLSGNIEIINDKIVISIRVLNVKSQQIERTLITYFKDRPDQVENMLKLSLKKLFGLKINQKLYKELSINETALDIASI